MDPSSENIAELYRRAHALFGRPALWNLRQLDRPTAKDALAVTAALRTHGGMDGRRLAEQIEALCRADQ